MAKLNVEIVTGERLLLSETDVDMVIAPGAAGQLGVLPHHAPLVTLLDEGELRLKKGTGERSIVIHGGFMEVTPEKVIVLADSAEHADESDLARAEEARRRAEAAIRDRGETVELEHALSALRRANLRLQVAKRRGTGVTSQPPRMGSGEG
ncbi:MAG: F0F1 ATP synthase subunit epsilon [Chloroflexota bacterium]